MAEHVWEERDLDGTVVATHWTTTKRDRNQQTALEIDRPTVGEDMNPPEASD